jgi:hypothetical protein
MSVLTRFVKRFGRREEGNATIEFSIYFSLFFLVFAGGVEGAFMGLRYVMLERSVDLVTRDIRLSTGHVPSYADVRDQICDKAKVTKDCTDNLRLEMIRVDPRNFARMPADADCRNAEEDPRPLREFVSGQDNQLMLIRACLKYKVMMPTTQVLNLYGADAQGYAHMIVTSAFVQEPR